MKAKADSLRYLSACFCLPQKELFLQEDLFGRLTQALSETCVEAIPFSKEMKKAFEEQDEERLRVDFAQLFIGPYELQAPPYGSVYLDGERRLMGDSTLEVMKLYEAAGLVLDQEVKEPPDHIAVELEFLSYLISQEAEALEKSETEKAMTFGNLKTLFLTKFLRPWVPPFCEHIKKATDNPFYQLLSNCLFTVISHLEE